MRSRYTAFALSDAEYLLRTWHPRTRPADLDLDPDRRWLFLEILRSEAGGPFDDSGIVEFIAHYRDSTVRATLHEVSRFVRSAAGWLYLDGELEA